MGIRSFSSCTTKYSQELLFLDISFQLLSKKIKEKQEFILELNSLKQGVIILDSVEKLDKELLNFFTRIPEITKLKVILISKVAWNDLHNGSSIVNPLIVEFSSYSRREILDILGKDVPEGVKKGFYMDFTKIVYETVYKSSRNLSEISLICKRLFPLFIKPVLKGEIKEEETAKLVQNVSKYLKEIGQDFLNFGGNCLNNSGVSRLELPFYTKFLLIASFLASFNPPRYVLFY
jgi:origin recognition complex subunit 5